MLGHCKDCKHWAPMPEATDKTGLDFWGKPNPPFVPDENTWREYFHEHLWDFAGPMCEGSDQAGEKTSIETSPEFGCVLFEAK